MAITFELHCLRVLTFLIYYIPCASHLKCRCEWNLNEVDPCDMDAWRSSVRSAMRAANQLPGKEPTDVDDAPASAR